MVSSCIVIDKTMRAPGVVEMRLHPTGGRLDHQPGQYLLVRGADEAERPYSICNAPRPDGDVSLLISRVGGGGVSDWLYNVVGTGDQVQVFGPHGATSVVTRPGPVLCLAGGCGLAPVLALVEATLRDCCSESLTVLVSARTERHLFAAELLERWALRHSNLRLVTTLTRARVAGRLHGRVPDVLHRVVADLRHHEVFAAGSDAFVGASLAAAGSLGAAQHQLHAMGTQAPKIAAPPAQGRSAGRPA